MWYKSIDGRDICFGCVLFWDFKLDRKNKQRNLQNPLIKCEILSPLCHDCYSRLTKVFSLYWAFQRQWQTHVRHSNVLLCYIDKWWLKLRNAFTLTFDNPDPYHKVFSNESNQSFLYLCSQYTLHMVWLFERFFYFKYQVWHNHGQLQTKYVICSDQYCSMEWQLKLIFNTNVQ